MRNTTNNLLAAILVFQIAVVILVDPFIPCKGVCLTVMLRDRVSQQMELSKQILRNPTKAFQLLEEDMDNNHHDHGHDSEVKYSSDYSSDYSGESYNYRSPAGSYSYYY